MRRTDVRRRARERTGDGRRGRRRPAWRSKEMQFLLGAYTSSTGANCGRWFDELKERILVECGMDFAERAAVSEEVRLNVATFCLPPLRHATRVAPDISNDCSLL
jgi:hypothetical protein